ncbi:Uncharacterised protein [Kluyvera cryocrescens]|uniref:Uncharacterized protein n=1 Tax=Kluyvera cryocrescens TaxID=580 RepID=A0A485AIW6_KLUCR|nr:Uncharacterised protein [Kluyvera cryocrescens]
MSVDHLLAHIRPQVEKLDITTQPSPFPGYILFLSASNAQDRAYTAYACGDSLDEAWQRAQDDLQRWASQQSRQPVWLRVDLVDKIQTLRWDALQEKLGKTKRNYFRFGLSFTPDFRQPILEQEINANALMYQGAEGVATPNAANLAHYGRWRFGHALRWPDEPQQLIWRFNTRSVFSDGKQVYPIESQGRNAGYRSVNTLAGRGA